ADAEVGDALARLALQRGPVDEPAARLAAHDRQPDVVLDGGAEDEALDLAVLGDQAETGLDGGVDVAPGQRATLERDRAGLVGVGPEDGPEHLGAAGTDEAGDADHLPGPDGERDVLEPTGRGEVLDAQQLLADRG